MILARPSSAIVRRSHRRELRRIRDRAGGDDAALARHEARYRRDRAEPARVGERHRGTGKVVRHQLVVTRLVDQLLVGREEFRETERVRELDDRDHEAAGAILALDIHRQPEIHVLGNDLERVGAALEHAGSHHRELAAATHQRPRNQVRERKLLGATGVLELRVEVGAARLEHPDRNVTKRRRDRDRE